MSSVTRSFDCVMCFCAQYSIAVLQACCHNLSWNGDIEKLFHHSSRWNGPLPMIRSRNERKNGKRDILNFVHTHTHHIHNGVEFPLRLTWQRDSILLKVFFSLLFCTYRPFVRGLCALQTITSNTITLAIQFDSNSLKLNGFNIYMNWTRTSSSWALVLFAQFLHIKIIPIISKNTPKLFIAFSFKLHSIRLLFSIHPFWLQ